jgi:uncharacterized membrane protein
VTFELEPALQDDLFVQGGASISFTFYASATLPTTPGTISVEILDDGTSIANTTTSFTNAAIAQPVSVDILDADHTFVGGHRIYAKVIVDGGVMRYGSGLAPTHLTVRCDPVSQISASTYDGNGNPTLLFYPNNYPKKTLSIKGTVVDAFGDQDISAVNINITKSGELVEGGAANYSAGEFEFTWRYESENITAGQHDYRVTVVDLQGNEYITTSHFIMAEEGVIITSPSQEQEGTGPAFKSAPYSGSTVYTLYIRNTGLSTTTYDLLLGSMDAALGALVGGNSVTVLPGAYVQASLTVNTTGKSPQDVVNISVSAISSSASSTLFTNTKVSPYSIYISLNGDNNQTILRGESAVYEISVYNSGFDYTTVDIELEVPSQWSASVTPDRILNLPASAQMAVNVTITTPVNLEKMRETVTIKLTGTVEQEPIIFYELGLVATATNPIWLELLDEPIKSIDPDTPVRFSFSLYNMLPIPNVISLSVTGLNSNWQTTMQPSNSVLVPAGESELVTMQLIPSTRVESRSYTPFLTARSSQNSSQSDSASVHVSVNPVHALEISSNISALTLKPGDKVTRTFTLENGGNIAEIVNLKSEVQKGSQIYDWSTFDDNQVTLSLQEEETITITIEVPEDTGMGQYTLFINGTTTSQQVSADPVTVEIFQTPGYMAQQAAKAMAAPIILLALLIFVVFKILTKK